MMAKIYIIVLLLGGVSFIYAQSINEQIEAIKKADAKERVGMMNRLKTQIAKMNEQERFETLQMLQKNMNSPNKGFQNGIQNSIIKDKSSAHEQSRFKNRALSETKQQGKR